MASNSAKAKWGEESRKRENLRKMWSSYKQYEYVGDIKIDIYSLISKLEESNVSNFSEFLELWQRDGYPEFYSGITRTFVMHSFVEDCFNVVCDTITSSATHISVVYAIFLLYVLYYLQIGEPRMQIRVTLDAWKRILAFADEAKRNNEKERLYLFGMLCYEQAFSFCSALNVVYPLPSLFRQKKMAVASMPDNLTNIFTRPELSKLSKMQEEYHRMKCLLNHSDPTKPTPSLSVVEKDVSLVLDDHLSTCVSSWTKVFQKESSMSDCQSDNSEEEDATVLQRRESIRQRAFCCGTEASSLKSSNEIACKVKSKRRRKRRK